MARYNQQRTLFVVLFIFIAHNTLLAGGEKLLDQLTEKLKDNSVVGEERVNTLTSLSFAYHQKNWEKGISYGQDALKLAKKHGYQKGVANAYNAMGVNYWSVDEFVKALECYNQALSIYEELELHEKAIRTFINKAVTYADQADYQEAITYYQEALKVIKIHNIEGLEPVVLNNMGIVYKEMGDYPKALSSYLTFLAYAQRIGNKGWEFKARYNAGNIYLRTKDYPAGMREFRLGLQLAKEEENIAHKGKATRAIGVVYKLTNKLDSAASHYVQALEYYREIKRKPGETLVLNDLGALYIAKKEYNQALPYLHEALQLRQQSGRKNSIALVLNNIGKAYLGLSQLDQAELYTQKAYVLAKEIEDLGKTLNAAKALAQIYENQQQHKKALFYQKEYIALYDSTMNKDQIKKISQLEAKHDYEQRTYQLKVEQEKEVSAYQQRQQVLTISGVLMFILAIVSYRSYKRKQKSNELLARQSILLQDQTEELSIQNEELTAINLQLDQTNQALELSRKKEKELMEETIQHKEQQLAITMMASFEKNELMEQIERKVRQLESGVSKEIKLKLREIKRVASANKHLDKDWDSFVHQFDNVHPQFFEKLQQDNPSLTINDLKVCAYLKIGMQTKEIATITNVSPGSTYKQLYRLKKKLALPTDMTVRDWVFSL